MPTRSVIASRVHLSLGKHHQILITDINDILQAQNLEILESHGWHGRKSWTKLNLQAPTSVLASVSQGTSLVRSANFTAAMQDRLIRISTEADYYRLTSVTPGSYAYLSDHIGERIEYPKDPSTATANIFQFIYSMPTYAEKVLAMRAEIPLYERDLDFLTMLDPRMQSQTSPPWAWAHFGRDAYNRIQVVVFPPPSQNKGLTIHFMRKADLANDSDEPLYRSDVLAWKAAVTGCGFLFARTSDATWLSLADHYNDYYLKALEMAKEDDLLKQSTPTAIVPDEALGLSSDQFRLDHDIGSW